MFVSKDENKRKRSRDWPIDPNSLLLFQEMRQGDLRQLLDKEKPTSVSGPRISGPRVRRMLHQDHR